MTTAQDILHYIETLAPRDLAMDWDNVGLLCGRANKEVKRILVALDPFTHVCEEAVELGADLLLTHHPLIFTPLSTLTDQSTTGQSIITLIRHDICAINAHTNLDCAVGGVNDTLASRLGLHDYQKITEDHEGLLRQGFVPQQALDAFMQQVKEALNCPALRYVSGGKPVSKVAVGGGSCASALGLVAKAGCDTFVTADIKYNQFWEAKELGVNLIDAGHFYTENPVVSVLAEKVGSAFPEIQVFVSQKHADCMKFF